MIFNMNDLVSFEYYAEEAEPKAKHTEFKKFDMLDHLRRQRAFSERAFGPHFRYKGIIEHIKEELIEIEKDPHDVVEWIDVALLAFDGAWRSGHSPEEILAAFVNKLAKNEARDWPDWRTVSEDKPIKHIEESKKTGTLEDCAVDHNGEIISYVNPKMLDKQNAWDKLGAIKLLHVLRHVLHQDMEKINDPVELHKHWQSCIQIELELQDLWGFERNVNFIQFWKVPKCSCPVYDNMDNYPTGPYVIDLGCLVHGKIHES
jgi:hypothetical protein